MPGLAVLDSTRLTVEGFGESPGIEVAPDGTVYATARQNADSGDGADNVRSSRLWVSADGGSGFREIAAADGESGLSNLPFGQHGDLAVNEKGHAYFVDLTLAQSTLSRSTDGGRTWEVRNPAVLAVPWSDRTWVAAGPGDRVAVTWRTLFPVTVANPLYYVWAAVSNDGGRTFPTQTAITPAGEGWTGGIEVAPDGTIAVGREVGGAVVYVSRDAGATFQKTIAHATENPTAYGAVSVAADGDSRLYVAWAEYDGRNTRVYYAASADHGSSWTKPVLVSDPAGAASHPWIDAADDGHVAIAFYAAPDDRGDPNSVRGPWWPTVADVRDAASAHPDVARAILSQEPVHDGTLCTRGFQACGGVPPLGDHLQVAVGPDGRVHAVWATSDRNVFWGVAERA